MATEEELQNSALRSVEHTEYETVEVSTTINAMSSDVVDGKGKDKETATNDGAMELDDQDASGEEFDQDAEGEEDNYYLLQQQITVDEHDRNDPSPVDEEGDVDASGEEDDQEEGVGAVKFKPGDSDEDDEDEDEDARSEDSSLPSAPEDESDEEAPWEDAEEAGDDDESEAALPNNCIFCKQDEESDPSEEFEAYLACARCGDNGEHPFLKVYMGTMLTIPAHQQCARDAAAMSEENSALSILI